MLRGRVRRWSAVAACVVASVVAASTADALRADGPTPAEIADLVAELRDRDPHVREVARRALVKLGAAPVGALADAALGGDGGLAAEALTVLAEIGPPAAPVAARLADAAARSDDASLLRIVSVLARIDPQTAAPLVDRIALLVVSRDEKLQAASIEVLAALGPVASPAAKLLKEQVRAVPSALRPRVATALRAIGADPTEMLLDLWVTPSHREEEWVPAALAALGEPAVRAAAGRLRDEKSDVRVRAVEVLAAMGPVARTAVPDLTAALRDEAGAVRRAAARALGTMGAGGAPALPALIECIADASLRTQRDALAAAVEILSAQASAAPPASVAAPATKTDAAIRAGADWLARHQADDGRWDADAAAGRCAGAPCAGGGRNEYDVGVTGLALLALLGSGDTHHAGPHAENVRRGLAWLREKQDAEGCFGIRTSQHFQYNHLCAALAAVEAYGATMSPALRESAQLAVKFVQESQNPYLGWRYGVRNGDNDTSVTAWAVQVLKAAEAAHLDAEPERVTGGLAWVDKMTDRETGRVGYQQRGGRPARTNDMLPRFPPEESEALTAAGLSVRVAAGRTAKNDPLVAKGVALLLAKPPKWDAGTGTTDLYYWFHGTRALRVLGGAHWDTWRKGVVEVLLANQDKGATCARGSWPPDDPWGPDGGRVYSTATAVLCLVPCTTAPDRRLPATSDSRAVSAALAVAAKSDDAQVRADAEAALARLRATYR